MINGLWSYTQDIFLNQVAYNKASKTKDKFIGELEYQAEQV